jgi:hypothetical protein
MENLIRQQFEEWYAAAEGFNPHINNFKLDAEGDYEADHTWDSFNVWLPMQEKVIKLERALAIRERQVKMLTASVCEKITKIQFRRDKLNFFRSMAYLGWALAITGPLSIILW